jgi:hypothetical protein
LNKQDYVALMKEIAAKFGYVEGSVKGTLEERKNFRQNHWFIIEVWEGMYRTMILIFLKTKQYDVDVTSLDEVEEEFSKLETFQGKCHKL